MLTFQQDFFERTADASPESIAVDDHGDCVTYGGLEKRANQIAHLLQGLGSAPNERVCVFAGKNANAYAAILGVLKSGGCWVPLSSAFPHERLAGLLGMLRPRAVIVEASTLAAAVKLREEGEQNFEIILLGGEATHDVHDERHIATQPVERPSRSNFSPDDLAYIIFTSGSTGTAKGVMVLHRNTTQFLGLCGEFFDIAEGSRFAHFSELTFDPSIFDLFYCWARGGTVVPFNRRSYRINPGLFLREQRINVLFTVPSVIASLSDSGQIGLPELATLEHLLVTGEAIAPKLVQQWYEAYPNSTIYNMYGTTETAIVSHWYKIPQQFDAGSQLPVGRPLPGTRIMILDGEKPTIQGEAGECVVYGSQLSPGYWANPFQTSLSFVRNPLDAVLPQVVYRTGDVLREGDDSLFYYVGRTDSQVKVRGHRVELGEVENALMQHSAVWEAAVVAVGLSEGGYDKQLVAFTRAERELSTKSLLQFVSELLPNYMVPSKITILTEEMPRNQNGKVDRIALRLLAVDMLEKGGRDGE